jgi:hypothetical protein
MKSWKSLCLLLIVSASFFLSCSTTSVTYVWKKDAYQGKAHKIVVIMAAKMPEIRKIFEDRFVAELDKRGNNAIQSYKIIPMEQLSDREFAKSIIESEGADTVLFSRLVDSKTVETEMSGNVYAVPGPYHGWRTYYDTVFSSGSSYTGNMQVAYIETNVYDMKTGKLIWSAHSKTERSEGEQQLINAFIKVIISRLASADVIQ